MLVVTVSLGAQQPVLPLMPMPAVEPGVPAFLLQPPAATLWTVPIPAAPMHPPLIRGSRIFVTTLPGLLAAHDLRDGHELWRVTLTASQQVAADDERVYVAAGEELHALDAATGAVAWRIPTGTLTAPPVAEGGWVIVSPARRTTALRAADGTVVWSRENALQRDRATLAGDVVILPLRTGVVQALEITTGATRWERAVGGFPAESLVVGERVYVGATNKVFYCLKLASGAIEWPIRVGAEIRGTAAGDDDRVYFAALDNVVRAVDRISGTQRWQMGLPFRPLSGPRVVGGSVFLAGPSADIHLLDPVAGGQAGKMSFPDPLAISPGIGDFEGAVVAAGITGGLNESWKLILVSHRSNLPSFAGPSISR
ncbi:MAG: PQQ-binding-like beta-propeller repeat protein [Vicinamibacterales bacterium]